MREVDMKCLYATILTQDSWLSHLRFDHLYFRSLVQLANKKLVLGISKIISHMKAYEICVVESSLGILLSHMQHRNQLVCSMLFIQMCLILLKFHHFEETCILTYLWIILTRFDYFFTKPKIKAFTMYKKFKVLAEKEFDKILELNTLQRNSNPIVIQMTQYMR